MADDQDYEELLSQNVGEVKSSVRDLENADYRQLLQLEREGKDRKTVKEFLESRLEEEDSKDSVEDETEAPQSHNSKEEAIEEETSGGLLGSFSRSSVLASGVVLGVLIGLVAAYGALGGAANSGMVSQGEVESSINELFTTSGMDASQFEVTEFTQQNGMHYVSINVTRESGNETQTSSRSYFVSPDGELLFPELRSQLVQTPINIEETIQQIQARQAQQDQTNGNTTQ
jgi:hypothetical protein